MKECPNKQCRLHGVGFETYNFCSSCGSELVKTKKCICGQPKTMDKFCVYCGARN